MSKNVSMLSALFFVFLVLVMTNTSTGTSLPPSASAPADELRLTEQREITIEEGRIVSLSPNGKWLLSSKKDELCFYTTESLTEHSCVNVATGEPDLKNIVWSPDSTRVAFTENFARLLSESDVWVVEVATGALHNLTDDGLTGSILKKSDDGSLIDVEADVIPAWSSDSDSLIFSRSARIDEEWKGTDLYSIEVARGAEPYKLLTVSDKEIAATLGGTYWLTDENKILYCILGHKAHDPNNGVWLIPWGSQTPQQLIRFADSEKGPAFLVDVAVQQGKALLQYNLASTYPSPPLNISAFALLDLTTGKVTPLKKTADDMMESINEETAFIGPMNATFSPDGSKILYVYETPDGSGSVLVVRDLDEETENVLLTHDDPLGGNLKTMLAWADNDTVYVATQPGSGLLLSLDRANASPHTDALQPGALYETALHFVHSLENSWDKELAFLDIIIGLITTDHLEQADNVLEELFELANSKPPSMPGMMDAFTKKLSVLAASGKVREAIDLVEALVVSKQKDMSFMKLAMALAESGNITEAIEVTHAMDETSQGTVYEANALKTIVSVSAESGQFDTALEVVNSMTDEMHKINSLQEIAVIFVEIERLDKVLDIVYSLDRKLQSFALKNIALALAEAGHIDTAIEVAEKMRVQDESTRHYRNKKIALARITSYALALNLDAGQQTELAQKIMRAFNQKADEPSPISPFPETVDGIAKSVEEVFRQFMESIQEGDLEKTRSLCHPEFLEEEGEDFSENFASAHEELSQVILEQVEVVEITVEGNIATATIKIVFQGLEAEEGEATFKKHEDRWLIYEL